MTGLANPRTQRSIVRHLKYGIALVALLVGGVGGWAATTDIAGAVIAQGALVVDSNVKRVQHPTGGTVGEVRVRDGDHVRAGDILVRLDDTVTRANLAIVTKNLSELWTRKARLEAERDGAEAITFPPELSALDGEVDVDIPKLTASERKLFDARRFARIGQKAQLQQRIAQLGEEIAGFKAQEQAKAREIVLIKRELDGARDLWEKNLMPISKLTMLEREATRLDGARAQLISSIAQSKGKIAETELQILQVDRDLNSEVGKDLRDIDGRTGELVERKVAAEDQLKRIDIRAPQEGYVHQSAVHTVGGVINAGDTVMVIVPELDKLAVEAKVLPQDIDQLRLGQQTSVRFSAFNQRTTPVVNGALSRISADTTTDQRTGVAYYTIRVTMAESEIARLGEVKLVPGMVAEVFIQTGDRKVVSYLVKPLQDQIMRAFRER